MEPITPEVNAPDAGQTAETNVDTSATKTEAAAPATETTDDTVSKKDFNKAYWKQKQTERENVDLRAQLDQRGTLTPAPVIPAASTGEPTLEQFDFDQDAYTAALVNHRVKEGIGSAFAERDNAAKAERQQADVAKVNDTFNARYDEYASENPEYREIAEAAGTKAFAPHINQAVLYAENGPQIDHYLLTHPLEADKLGAMHPTTAAIEIGKISATLSAKPNIKPSNAPDPIETVGGGGAPSHDIRFDKDASMEDYYKASMVGKNKKE